MKKKLKGFTLIELIVVMAIFGIIMFGALQLIPPVMKMMVQADVHEGGNAAVSSISNYLENSLTTVEYLDVYNTLPADDATLDTRVKDFATYYYEGVLKSGSSPESREYAEGEIHVMVIDNSDTGNGKISTHTYNATFATGNVQVSENESAYVDWAVNRAYYDDYTYALKLGLYEDDTYFYDPIDYVELATNLSSRNTVFTIMASTERNNQTYSFFSNATMSLVNIYNRGGGGVPTYYVVNQKLETLDEDADDDAAIVPITDPQSNRIDKPEFLLAREYGAVDKGTRVFSDTLPEGTKESYCFIYTYPSEIITN